MKPSRSNSRPAASLLNWASDQQILPAILDGHVEDAQQMLDDALDAIEAAFEARRIALPGKRVRGIETGLASHVGPDHSAALAAVELVIKTMTVGRRIPKARRERKGISIEELEVLVAAEKADSQPPEHRDQARQQVEQKFYVTWNSPKVQTTAALPDLVAARRQRIERLLDRMREVKQAAFGARHIVGRRTGGICMPIDLGPDHRIRLRAADLLVDIVTAGRPTPEAPEPVKRKASVEELRERWEAAIQVEISETSNHN